MTLGGLALAVGILVDDADRHHREYQTGHLEQGKEIEAGDSRWARDRSWCRRPVTAVHLHRFRADVRLGGVAGYLFRPLAEAVMLALAASYVLSRTLVPTLANYLLRNQHAHGSSDGSADAPAKPSRNPLARFQRGFEHYFERVRNGYLG